MPTATQSRLIGGYRINNNIKDGSNVTCNIRGIDIVNARVRIVGDRLYICQNHFSGAVVSGTRFGYRYSWAMDHDVKSLRPVKQPEAVCDGCGSDTTNYVQYTAKLLCVNCLDTKFFCDSCHNIYDRPIARTINGDNLCDDCFSDNYFICDDCGGTCSNDDCHDDGICVDCAEHNDDDDDADRGAINDASYMPALQFHKEAYENTLFQGIELEIELPDSVRPGDHSERFETWLTTNGLGKFLYFKEDGSLDNGYEIVSMPFTSKARHKLMNWHKVLKYLRGTKARSFDTESCGLHIHVSRQALSNTDIKKLKVFFCKHQGAIERVAGRKGNSYCEYEGYGLLEYKMDRILADSRYVAVNVNSGRRNKDTVEFRIFKGTLNFERFMGCLQFTEAVCEFVKVHGITSIMSDSSWRMFKEWVKRSERYEHLIRHLKKVGA